MVIKAVIFDCFGVLTTEGWQASKRERFAGRPAELKRAIELNRMMDAALIDYDEGVREIAGLAGVRPAELDRILRDIVPDEELLAYIRRELRPKYRLGILSNVAGNWLKTSFKPVDLRLFDVVTLSYESGAVKPDSRAYTSIAERLGVVVEGGVPNDDRQRKGGGAEAAGMRTILYKDFEQMRGELERLLAADTEG